MNKIPIYAIITIILFGLSACKGRDPNDKKLAQVGSEILYESQFKANFSDAEWENLSSADRKKYLEDWVNITLLAKEAEAMDLDKEPVVTQRIQYATKKIKANALIASRLQQYKISEDEMFNYYRIHMAEFQKPLLEYKVQRIFVPEQNRLQQVKAEIDRGLDFDVAVSRYSQEELRLSGGFMGFVSNADSVFWNVANTLARGKTAMVQDSRGWYLIRHTEDRKAGDEAGFDLYKAEIRQRILKEKQEQVYRDLLLELKQQNSKIYYY